MTQRFRSLDYQFLLGNEILVAPVLATNAREWRVYLPEGEWVNWWTGEHYSGSQWITVSAALMEIPLLVRGGAIIPQLPSDVDTLAPAVDASVKVANDDLVIDLYPSRNRDSAIFTLWDGTTFHWNATSGAFRITGSPLVRQYKIQLKFSPPIDSVQVNGHEISQGMQTNNWQYHADHQYTIINLQGDNFDLILHPDS